MKPDYIRDDFPLSRLTTVRTGGAAQYFAAVSSKDQLLEALAWAARCSQFAGVVGSGSNLLVADEGVRGLVLKLEGELAKIEIENERVICGGGARLPQVATRAARAGLAGLSFGINIPGSVGGALKMNANAYGGVLAEVLEWADAASAKGSKRRTPEQFNFSYRSSNLEPDEVVFQASFNLKRKDPAEIKQLMAAMRSARKEAQPSGIKTFGSTFKNPIDDSAGRSAGQLLDAAGCRGLSVGGACFNRKHANFVENSGGATTSDVVQLMAEGKRRVREQLGIELEPEVQFLGQVDLPSNFWEASV